MFRTGSFRHHYTPGFLPKLETYIWLSEPKVSNFQCMVFFFNKQINNKGHVLSNSNIFLVWKHENNLKKLNQNMRFHDLQNTAI